MKKVSDSNIPEDVQRKLIQRGYRDLEQIKTWKEDDLTEFQRHRGVGEKTIEKLRQWLRSGD